MHLGPVGIALPRFSSTTPNPSPPASRAARERWGVDAMHVALECAADIQRNKSKTPQIRRVAHGLNGAQQVRAVPPLFSPRTRH